MKRSQINALMHEAEALFADHQILLPPWATWSPADWQDNPETARWCYDHQMGWDITDYGGGDFASRGLTLFCIRNGRQGVAGEAPYAEKIMVVREGQETPLHLHRVKMEDIIVRGGGNLVLELYNTDEAGARLDTPVSVRTDGMPRSVEAGAPLVLHPGQSIRITRGLYHRFYGEHGTGTALVGEVSQVNDDLADNHYFDANDRFSDIEEDEPPLYPLWTELSA